MRERPILFNGAMVRAILAGQKTQTRRAVKPSPPAFHVWAGWCSSSTCKADEGKAVWAAGEGPLMHNAHRIACPFGQPGDRLWVRETTVNVEKHGYLGPVYLESDDGYATLQGGLAPAPDDMIEVEPHEITLRPSIHMPRSMCRLVLEITAVRVERLQEISAIDCLAEGIKPDAGGGFHVAGGTHYSAHPDESFASLWTSTGGDWDSNPWVWVIEFKRAEESHG